MWPALLAVAVQGDVWGAPPIGLGHVLGPRPLLALLYAVTSLALAWRRQAPLIVLAFVVTLDSAYYLAFGSPQGLGSFLPVFFAFYAVGRYSRPANLLTAAPLTLLGLAVHEVLDPDFDLSGSTAIYWLVLAVAWPLGYAFRRRALERDALADHARELAEDRDRMAAVAAEAERARIASELHDVVGHGLSVIVLQLVAALGVLDKGDLPATRERLLTTERSARDALAEMRRLLDLLDDGSAGSLAPQPGLAQLSRLVADTRSAGADIELTVTGTPADLPPGVELAAFRILQESLTNVLKHARPPRARICLSYAPGAVEVEVRDDGRSPQDANPAGRGLSGMRQRVGLYDGELEVGPMADGGFRVHARLPVPA